MTASFGPHAYGPGECSVHGQAGEAAKYVGTSPACGAASPWGPMCAVTDRVVL